MIRYSVIPELQRCFVEDVRGTAMHHLGRGLYEAHARDEAGYGAEGGTSRCGSRRATSPSSTPSPRTRPTA